MRGRRREREEEGATKEGDGRQGKWDGEGLARRDRERKLMGFN